MNLRVGISRIIRAAGVVYWLVALLIVGVSAHDTYQAARGPVWARDTIVKPAPAANRFDQFDPVQPSRSLSVAASLELATREAGVRLMWAGVLFVGLWAAIRTMRWIVLGFMEPKVRSDT